MYCRNLRVSREYLRLLSQYSSYHQLTKNLEAVKKLYKMAMKNNRDHRRWLFQRKYVISSCDNRCYDLEYAIFVTYVKKVLAKDSVKDANILITNVFPNFGINISDDDAVRHQNSRLEGLCERELCEEMGRSAGSLSCLNEKIRRPSKNFRTRHRKIIKEC